MSDLPDRKRIRNDWESDRLFADVVNQVPADTPLEDEERARALGSLTKGYGDTICAAVVAAADGYFDGEYPATLRAWWLAVARELRGRTARDDRALRRLGVGALGRIIL